MDKKCVECFVRLYKIYKLMLEGLSEYSIKRIAVGTGIEARYPLPLKYSVVRCKPVTHSYIPSLTHGLRHVAQW